MFRRLVGQSALQEGISLVYWLLVLELWLLLLLLLRGLEQFVPSVGRSVGVAGRDFIGVVAVCFGTVVVAASAAAWVRAICSVGR